MKEDKAVAYINRDFFLGIVLRNSVVLGSGRHFSKLEVILLL